MIEVVLPVRAWGISPEQLHLELPHLSLGQIYSALAYYWGHKEEIDADIRKRRDYVDRLRNERGQPPIASHLSALRGG